MKGSVWKVAQSTFFTWAKKSQGKWDGSFNSELNNRMSPILADEILTIGEDFALREFTNARAQPSGEVC